MKWGTLIAMAALMVNAPRLIVTYLEIDRLGLPADWEQMLLIATAIATGIVLSGGGAYIAHTIAERPGNGWHQWVLVGSYLLMLMFTVILIAPMLMVGLRQTELTQVLTTQDMQWVWCIVAVVSVEVLAAACMVAVVLESGHERHVQNGGPSLWGQIAQAAAHRVVAEIETPRQSAVMQAPTPMAEDGLLNLEAFDDTDLGELEDFADYEEPPQVVTQPAALVVHEPPRVVARQADDMPNVGFATLQELLTRQEPTAPRQTAPRQSTQERVNQLNAMSETTVEQVAQTFNIAPRSAQRLLAQSALAPIGNGVWARQQHPQIAAD